MPLGEGWEESEAVEGMSDCGCGMGLGMVWASCGALDHGDKASLIPVTNTAPLTAEESPELWLFQAFALQENRQAPPGLSGSRAGWGPALVAACLTNRPKRRRQVAIFTQPPAPAH